MALLRFLLAWTAMAVLLHVARLVVGFDAPVADAATSWGLAPAAMLAGRPPGVPPLWPALAAAVSFLASIPASSAGVWVSLVSAAGVPPAAAGLARRTGASWAIAGLVALVSLVAVLPFAYAHGPASLFALLLLFSAAAGMSWEADPDEPVALVGWVLFTVALPLASTMGIVVVAALALALAARRTPRAAAEVAVGTLGLLVFAVATGGVARLPGAISGPLLAGPWAVGQGPVPAWADAATAAAWQHGDRWSVALGFLGEFVSPARSASGVVLAGFLAVLATAAGADPRDRKGPPAWSVLVPLAPAVVMLLAWTEPDWLLVLVPVAAVGLGVGASQLGEGRWQRSSLALAVPVLYLVAVPLPGRLHALAAPAPMVANGACLPSADASGDGVADHDVAPEDVPACRE